MTALALRAEAYRIAAMTGYDHRTCRKALEKGVEAIHSLKIQEDLRPHVEAFRALTAEGGP